MAHRSIHLELTPTGEVWLADHIEDDWAVAQTFHDCMREMILRRGGQILYSAILNLEADDKKG